MERVLSGDWVRIREISVEKGTRPGPVDQGSLTKTQWVTPIGVLDIVLRGGSVVAANFVDNDSYIQPLGTNFAKPTFPIEVQLCGTEFQLNVWRILGQIPRGETVTYQWIAQQIGLPKASRAVGQAVGANPIAWLVPCHRVVPKGGGLGGYRWGPTIKEKLLAAERSKKDLRSYYDIDYQNQMS
jgi:O-6-methylguanine DNA methyltransferase